MYCRQQVSSKRHTKNNNKDVSVDMQQNCFYSSYGLLMHINEATSRVGFTLCQCEVQEAQEDDGEDDEPHDFPASAL